MFIKALELHLLALVGLSPSVFQRKWVLGASWICLWTVAISILRSTIVLFLLIGGI